MRKYIKRKSCPVIIHTYVHTHTYEFTHVRTYINALASHIPYISSYCIPNVAIVFFFFAFASMRYFYGWLGYTAYIYMAILHPLNTFK